MTNGGVTCRSVRRRSSVIYGNEASYLDEEEIIYVSSAEEDEGEKDSALE